MSIVVYDRAAEDVRCQIDSTKVVVRLIRAGLAAGLPGLEWTVATVGQITGTVRETEGDPRGVFAAWSAFLTASPMRTYYYDGQTHLRAFARQVLGTLESVALAADIRQDEQAAIIAGGDPR